MCFDTTARPPLPPIAGGAGIAESAALELQAADGNRFMAFSATTAEPQAPGVVILPDVRGLHPFYTDLAERFAAAGVHATALDYFGRTAGMGERGGDFPHMDHVQQTTPDGVAADVSAAVAHVRSLGGGAAASISTVGFCSRARPAGRRRFLRPPQQRSDDDTNAPTMLASGYACKVLGLFGGADQGIPPEAIAAFGAALDDAHVEHDLVTYDGAPHSFFDRKFGDFKDECDDAWRRILRFVADG
jgi:carboxymethylenebutenolidase